MAGLMLKLALLLLSLVGISSALQVTRNSPCSKLCLNGAGLPTISSSDVSCNDAEYSKETGQKFRKCIECLQTSSFGTDEENDQGWFIYNLRFAADWCMYAPDNAQRIGGPCMDSVTCGGLESPLDASNPDPKNTTTFNYCDVGGGSFSSEATVCNDCVQHMPENKYLSNWIVALQAGCSQKPSQNALIGLTGSIFDKKAIAIAAPLSPGDVRLKDKDEKSGLPMQAIIGIVVGVVVTALILIGVFAYKCFKKRKARKAEAINSKCHSRFGAVDIPAPLNGAYSEYKPEPVVEVAPWDEDFVMKEMRTDSRASGHTKLSSVSSGGSSELLNPERDHARKTAASEAPPPTKAEREVAFIAPEQPAQQQRAEPRPQPRHASPQPERNSVHMNPLRMNSYTGVSSNSGQKRSSVATIGIAMTAPAPRDIPTPQQFTPTPPRFTPTPPRGTPPPPQHTPTPPLAQPQGRSARSARTTHIPPPLNLQSATTYGSASQPQPSPRPGCASSIISSTSTTFSPGVYNSPPPAYQSPVRATFNFQSSQRGSQHPAVPKSTYNPADYAPKPTNPYHQPQPQFNIQPRSYSPGPAQPSRAFHRPQPSVASTSSRFSFASSMHTPPPQLPPPPKHPSVPKQKDSAVPIIAIPIPAPKRQTVDLRNLVGMNLKQHISPESEEAPSMPKLKNQGTEVPKGIDRTESLLAKSSPPFRSLARNLNPEAAMTLPPTETKAAPTLDEGTIQVQRPDSRASYRGRSASRPRRESLPRGQGRDRSGSRIRYRSRSRDVDLEGGDGRKNKKRFSFGFKGQDTVSAVDERSPQSGNKTDVEQWPGNM